MSDLVRKADVLPIFCMRCVRVIDCVNDMTGNFKNNCPIKKEVDDLPSAESDWIPVSERLPEELKYVLVCTKRGYVTCGYCVNDFNYGCVDKDFFLNLDDVVAWMPLPEPWEGE